VKRKSFYLAFPSYRQGFWEIMTDLGIEKERRTYIDEHDEDYDENEYTYGKIIALEEVLGVLLDVQPEVREMIRKKLSEEEEDGLCSED